MYSLKFIAIVLLFWLASLQAIEWNGNWAFGCDFRNRDLANAQIKGAECGGRCSTTPQCTHFSWNSYNGGTCWMKYGPVSKSDAFETGDRGMVCGVITESNVNKRDVLATRHVNGGGDACALPSADYNVKYPLALGDIGALGKLKFTPDLCGHVLQINCGNGNLDVIITNSNYGGGLDLYSETTWPKATNNLPPGQTLCSVLLSPANAINGKEFQCYYKPGTGSNNLYYRNIGLLNTRNKIVTKATRNGIPGEHRGDNIYYAFDGRGQPMQPSEEVIFTFNDGSTYKVKFSDCIDVGSEQNWR
ncbi:uncharacterized protein LOC136091291 [Hydra vulgaris]|uniref:Uncharacterized protein LOC136091291 n=1 Tax=Hydra vulgaris TaxID=6087 RepID=A0ABM4DJP1_HYDVU